jgi:hypothetical protein
MEPYACLNVAGAAEPPDDTEAAKTPVPYWSLRMISLLVWFAMHTKTVLLLQYLKPDLAKYYLKPEVWHGIVLNLNN